MGLLLKSESKRQSLERRRNRADTIQAMTEAEWLFSEDPAAMVRFLRGRTSDRKMRLFACAFTILKSQRGLPSVGFQ